MKDNSLQPYIENVGKELNIMAKEYFSEETEKILGQVGYAYFSECFKTATLLYEQVKAIENPLLQTLLLQMIVIIIHNNTEEIVKLLSDYYTFKSCLETLKEETIFGNITTKQ